MPIRLGQTKSQRPFCLNQDSRGRLRSRRSSTLLVAALAMVGGAGLTFGIATPASATGSTLYVSSTGTDTGSCTSSSAPCATISYAVGVAGSGDTIYVSGTIDDNVTVNTTLTIAQWPSGNPAVVNGMSHGTVITIDPGANVNIDQLTVTGGTADFQGGGIDNSGTLTVEDSTISGNVARIPNGAGGMGGGIFDNHGTLSVDDSTVSDNSVTSAGPGTGGSGGGISVQGGTASIDDSTVSDNVANSSSSNPGGEGGGVFNDGGTLSLDNSTVAGNSAIATGNGQPGYGGAIFNVYGSASVEESTISDNSVGALGTALGIFTYGGNATLAGDIFASPSNQLPPTECVASQGGAIIDGGYNIDDDASCGFSATGSVNESTTIDNFLGPLQNNGGSTDTIALLPGNSSNPDPSQGVIPSTFKAPGQSLAVCGQFDERGVARGAPCDMGAFALTTTNQLYALPDGTASAPCTTESTTASLVCPLGAAIAEANGGSGFVINLEAPTGDSSYTGIADAGVSDTVTSPVTIQADPDAGFDTATPTLDGKDSGLTVVSIIGNIDVTVNGVEIENGVAPLNDQGGGIFNGGTGTLTVSDATLFQNTAGYGAAISNSDGGTLDVSDSTFEGGYSEGGGAIANGSGGSGSGTLFVTDSLFFENAASVTNGDAILNGYGAGNDGTATISDSTFAIDSDPNNSSTAIDNGDNGGTGTLTLSNSTFSQNTADVLNGGGGTVTAKANIFAESCEQNGSWTDDGWNVGSDVTCFNGGAHDNDSAGSGLPALLGEITDNGGPTLTIEPLTGNPAIGIIPNPTSGLCPVAQDQRGDASAAGAACNAGAVQFSGQTIGSLSTSPSSTTVGGPGYTPSAIATSGLPVSITVDAVAASVCSMSSGVVTFDSTGTCTIDFNQAGDTDWAPAPQVQQQISVSQGSQSSQSIGSLSTPPTSVDVGDSGYTPTATATSGLPVAITVDSSASAVCSMSAGVVSYDSSGTCILDFNQAGDGNWAPAPEVQQSFIVSPGQGSQGISGYRLVESDGGVLSYGDATDFGSRAGSPLHAPIVGLATTPSGNGYWLVASDGGVFAYGDATFYGSRAGLSSSSPIVGIASTPNGGGYWLASADGGVFAYGDAKFYGSRSGLHLNKPIVGIATTANGDGYWLVAADGGVFSYGDATFYGSRGASPLSAPVVGITSAPSGNGYWLVGSDGGVFAYGDAEFEGSRAGSPLSRPIVGITSTASGDGYWLVGADGGVFCYGDANYDGSMGASEMTDPVVGIG
jgi:hypothetical protein